MANLRELLGSVEPNFTGIHSGGIGRLREGQVTYWKAYMCANCNDHETSECTAPAGDQTKGYNNYRYCCWKVPAYPGAGTTAITFEVWGAGGSGAGACCCAFGVPGGSGAYAYKTVVGVESGTPYNLFIGEMTCRQSCLCGRDGEKSYVTGIGLTNFCADGGTMGCSFCIREFTGNGKCTWKTSIGATEGFGGNDGIVGLGTDCMGFCAQYYGADGGAYGVPGSYSLNCHKNRCWNTINVPYPGGLVNQQGGHIMVHMCENSTCGYFHQCFAAGQIGFGGRREGNYVPGLGGPSATVCGGGCCCGTQGWAGAVRITVRYV